DLLRHAAVAADPDLLLTPLGAAGLDLDDLAPHFADLAAAGHRAALLHHAGHPHLARHPVVRRAPGAAGVAGVATARAAAPGAALAVAEGLPVRVLFTALPVAAIVALGDHLGLGDVAVVRPRHGALLAAGHLDADLAALFAPLGDLLVHRAHALATLVGRYAL